MELSDEVLSSVLESLQRKSRGSVYFNNPDIWAEEVLGVELWSKQREMLKSVAENKRTAVKSCHSSGKSFTMGILACWWVSTRGFQSLVVSTAPTYAQVHSIVWNEIRKHWGLAELPGEVTQGDVWNLTAKRSDGKERREMVAFGRRPADHDTAAFSGLHRENGVLFLIDEAVGVPEMIFTAAEVNTTSPLDRVFAIANPDDIQTAFGRIFEQDLSTWNKITISTYDTPNFTDEEVSDSLRAHMPQVQWVEDMKVQWGEESSRFKSKILAEFPSQSDFMFYTQADIDKAIDSGADWDAPDSSIRPDLGVDIARMGDDYTTVYGNWDGYVRLVDKWAGADLVETKQRVTELALKLGARSVRLDSTGIGAGVFDMFSNEMAEFEAAGKVYGFEVHEMLGSAKSPDNFRWANARAYRHDILRTKMRTRKMCIDPEDKSLIDEMLSARFELNDKGAIQMEPKKKMRSRGAKSPDHLDAVTYAVEDLSDGSEMQPGDVFRYDAAEFAEEKYGIPEFDALSW